MLKPAGLQQGVCLTTISDFQFNETFQDDTIGKMNLPTTNGLEAIGGFILLVAAIKFINLSTAQSVRRAREDCFGSV